MPGIMMQNYSDGVRTLKLRPKLSRIIGIAYDPQKISWAAEMFVQYIEKKKSVLIK